MSTHLFDIRKLTIISLFSDDDLMDILVLKGGNALEIAYNLNSRASMDIDVSMSKDFEDVGLTVEEVEKKITNALNTTFNENGYHVFDIRLNERPKNKKKVANLNWGGYLVEFKVTTNEKYKKIGSNLDQLRRESLPVYGDKKIVEIDISKFEFVEPSIEKDFFDYIIKIYTPRMIIFEKLRAICQQMTEYNPGTRTNKKPRARDFYDIYIVKENLDPSLDLTNEENINMLKDFFDIKNVPLKFLRQIKESSVYEFHLNDYPNLKDNVTDSEIKEFKFYYDYTVNLVEDIIPTIDQTL